jgi:hypothetical protein
MNKKEIDENQYIQLVNEKMKEHDMYTEGMKIENIPANIDQPSGYAVHDNGEAVVSWATKEIEKKYVFSIKKG